MHTTRIADSFPLPASAHAPSGFSEVAHDIPVVREPMPNRSPAAVEARSRSERVNRFFNVLIASVALVLVSPVMVIFAALVKLSSPGPIFYSQARVGLNRRRRPDDDLPYDRRS